MSSLFCLSDITISLGINGLLYGFGKNNFIDNNSNEKVIVTPKEINNLSNIIMISCGSHHCISLDYNGNVYSFGNNNYYQLGLGNDCTDIFVCIPQQINIPPCKYISCGDKFTICLSKDDNLYSFGYNSSGQLGIGNNENSSSPKQIHDLDNIDIIECGGNHTICKTFNNNIYAWGDNSSGQLTQKNICYSYNPIECNNWPDNIIDIKCGYEHTLLLSLEGHVYSFGSNISGELGLNENDLDAINYPKIINDIPKIKKIECGAFSSKCIDINNHLWLFGNNFKGQLGLGYKEYYYKPELHPTLNNIIDISSGGCHTFVKTIDNKIYAFGNNINLQLGIKTSEHYQLTPIQVLKDNEDIWVSTFGKSRAKSARK